MVLPSPVAVSGDLLAALVVAEGIGELHKTLEPEPLWHPPADLDVRRAQVGEMVRAHGWCDRAGRLDREVAASLAVLCRPDEEYYGWSSHGGVTSGFLAARIGKEGVLAVARPDGTVRLAGIPSGQLARRLVAQLPDVPAARLAPFTVSATDVRAGGRPRDGALVRRPSPEVRRARRLLARPTTGGGELSVACRDQWGRRVRARVPLHYADTDLGRIASHVVERADGDTLVRVQPGDRLLLTVTLQALHPHRSGSDELAPAEEAQR